MNKNFSKFILVTFIITSFFTQLVYSQDYCFDENSGVYWDTKSQKVTRYSDAEEYCENQGKRLPSFEEFQTLTSSINPCADALSFKNLDEYVTSTPVVIINGNSRTPHEYLFMKYSFMKNPNGSYRVVATSSSKKERYPKRLRAVCVQE